MVASLTTRQSITTMCDAVEGAVDSGFGADGVHERLRLIEHTTCTLQEDHESAVDSSGQDGEISGFDSADTTSSFNHPSSYTSCDDREGAIDPPAGLSSREKVRQRRSNHPDMGFIPEQTPFSGGSGMGDLAEYIRSQLAAQGIVNSGQTSTLSVDDSLNASRSTPESKDSVIKQKSNGAKRKRPLSVRSAREWTALGYPPDQAAAMESLQSDLIRDFARRDARDVVLRPLDEKGDEITRLACVPYHSDMLPHWKYLMKSINENSDIDGVEIYRISLPSGGMKVLLPRFDRAGIRRLMLSHCGLPKNDSKLLVRFIEKNVTLEEFGVAESSCLFDEQMSQDLEASLLAHPKLRRLYLASDSRISPSILRRILDACSGMDLVALSCPESGMDHMARFRALRASDRDIRLLSTRLCDRETLFVTLGDRREGEREDDENDLPEFNESFERSVKQMDRLRCRAHRVTTFSAEQCRKVGFKRWLQTIT